jgi:hypothetical protein
MSNLTRKVKRKHFRQPYGLIYKVQLAQYGQGIKWLFYRENRVDFFELEDEHVSEDIKRAQRGRPKSFMRLAVRDKIVTFIAEADDQIW